MVQKAVYSKVSTMLKDTITLLCKNSISFRKQFTIEAVIGITIDENDVFLVSMSELIKQATSENSSENNSSLDDVCSEDGQEIDQRRKRRRRKRQKRSEDEKANLADGNESSGDIVSQRQSMTENQEVTASLKLSDNKSHTDSDLLIIKQETNTDNDWSMQPVTPPMMATSDNAGQDGEHVMHYTGGETVMPNSSQQSPWLPESYSASSAQPIVVAPVTALSEDMTLPDMGENSGQQQERITLQAQRWTPFSCSHCHKSFSGRRYLKTHENTHFGVYPYHCCYCRKGFLTTQHLRLHINKHK